MSAIRSLTARAASPYLRPLNRAMLPISNRTISATGEGPGRGWSSPVTFQVRHSQTTENADYVADRHYVRR